MLRIYYRLCRAENPEKHRPAWYSKDRCLINFITARIEVSGGAEMTVLCDGEFPLVFDPTAYRPKKDQMILLKDESGGPIGNAASFRHAIRLATTPGFPDGDIVYFVEDDYLHTPDALVKLAEFFEEKHSDYATLYDHPARYNGMDVLRESGERIIHSKTHHWRTQESTCMTFAARVGTLREDSARITRYLVGEHPQDRWMFVNLQVTNPHRRLWGPIPSLATHCETEWLAPCVNWEAICGA